MDLVDNDFSFLNETYELLEQEGVETIVFGGWAEELQKIILPRPHKDIDLLYISEDFDTVDRFIKKFNLRMVKSFPHKRAFLHKGIMVELFLVKKGNSKYYTIFFDNYTHTWPLSVLGDNIVGMRVASIEILHDYRQNHGLIEKALVEYSQTP